MVFSHRRPAVAVLLAALLVTSLPVTAGSRAPDQDRVVGAWRGTLATPAGPLGLVIEIALADQGLSGSLSVPGRGLAGLPLENVELDPDGTFRFEFTADGARFAGTLAGSGSARRIRGTWFQAGQQVELELEPAGDGPAADPAGMQREQTPRPPFPYDVEEITLEAGAPLGCTVTSPSGPADGSRAAALLLSVAGPNTRDQTHFGHRPFLVLADHLTRQGVVVLRCDDRGVGASEGDLFAATMEDLAADALAGVERLRGRVDVDPGAVGIIGNSEGTVVGAMAAARSDRVAFLVLLGAAAVPGAELIGERRRAGLTGRDEASPEEIEESMAAYRRFVELVRAAGGVGLAAAQRTAPEIVDALRALVSDRRLGSDPTLPAEPEERLRLFLTPWYHSQLTEDGGRWLRQVQGAPVLALTGSLDRVNLPEQNLPAVHEALEVARNPDYTLSLLPGINHVMQEARTGSMAEYGELESTFAPLALRTISHWIGLRFGPDAL